MLRLLLFIWLLIRPGARLRQDRSRWSAARLVDGTLREPIRNSVVLHRGRPDRRGRTVAAWPCRRARR
jgi:hypothetical protein